MPKRKKSHEYCRNRFGIFSKRRRVLAAEHRCEECVMRAARPRRKSADKPAETETQHPVLELTTRGAAGQNTACDCQEFSTETALPALWLSSGNYSAKTDTTASSTAMEDISPTGNSADVVRNNTRGASSTAFSYAKPGMDLGGTEECSKTVSNLVVMTSSLKLSEGESPACKFDSELSRKFPVNKSSLHDLTDGCLPTCKHPGTCIAHHSVDCVSVTAPSSGSISSHTGTVSIKPIHTYRSIHELRRCVGSRRPPVRHVQWLLPPLPRVEEPHADSDDSDEGFSEPVAKKSHKASSDADSLVEPDEGVNVTEKFLPSPVRHQRTEYTNHSLDTSLGCTWSLYWQMMSNQYGVPTKIYSMGRNKLFHPLDGHTLAIPSPKCKLLDVTASMFGSSQCPGASMSHTEKDLCDCKDADIKTKLPLLDDEKLSSIFAVGSLAQDFGSVQGALGLCLRCVAHRNKSIFIFDCQASHGTLEEDGTGKWFQYCRVKSRFVPCQTVPVLTQNFAGLGVDELTEMGRIAIKAVFQKTFGTP